MHFTLFFFYFSVSTIFWSSDSMIVFLSACLSDCYPLRRRNANNFNERHGIKITSSSGQWPANRTNRTNRMNSPETEPKLRKKRQIANERNKTILGKICCLPSFSVSLLSLCWHCASDCGPNPVPSSKRVLLCPSNPSDIPTLPWASIGFSVIRSLWEVLIS